MLIFKKFFKKLRLLYKIPTTHLVYYDSDLLSEAEESDINQCFCCIKILKSVLDSGPSFPTSDKLHL